MLTSESDSNVNTSPRRRWAWGAALGVVVSLVAGGVYYRFEARYERDFAGWSETDLLNALGPPDVDSRRIPVHTVSADYKLVWYFSVGRHLGVDFQDGRVVRQGYGSK